MRGATAGHIGAADKIGISTHAPLAGRDQETVEGDVKEIKISTHAPLAGRDPRSRDKLIGQPRISTHAPLAGRDCQQLYQAESLHYFNPRAPCGARLCSLLRSIRCAHHFNPRAPCGARLYVDLPAPFLPKIFQPTRPLRGATASAAGHDAADDISIHAPLAGRDCTALTPCRQARYFNPRAPCGARRIFPRSSALRSGFQPTRPLRGATKELRKQQAGFKFQPTRPLRGATEVV